MKMRPIHHFDCNNHSSCSNAEGDIRWRRKAWVVEAEELDVDWPLAMKWRWIFPPRADLKYHHFRVPGLLDRFHLRSLCSHPFNFVVSIDSIKYVINRWKHEMHPIGIPKCERKKTLSQRSLFSFEISFHSISLAKKLLHHELALQQLLRFYDALINYQNLLYCWL